MSMAWLDFRTRNKKALEVLGKVYEAKGGSSEMHYEYILEVLRLSSKGSIRQPGSHFSDARPFRANSGKNYRQSMIDKLVEEGFIDRLYNKK